MENSQRKRRWSVCPLNVDRQSNGYFQKVFLNIKEEDELQFFIHTRMTRAVYDLLLGLVSPCLEKPRQLIGPEERLSMTLWYLAHGMSFQKIAWSYKIGKTTARNIILETCEAIWDVLSPLYLSEPTEAHYRNIAKDFRTTWDVPNCVGAIDGKHVAIVCPKNSGTTFYNYKKFYSIVLMASCDAKYIFTSVSVGITGSQFDGGVLQSSKFGKSLLENNLSLPPDAPLWDDDDQTFPFFFVGSAAFPLRKNLMRPYAGTQLPEIKEVFNYRLSRARRAIENSFGILAARWRVLRTIIECIPENCEKIVLVCLVLHNFIMVNDSERWYCPDKYADWENSENDLQKGGWQIELADVGGALPSITNNYRNSSVEVYNLRDKLADYFMNQGSVPFQYRNRQIKDTN